MSELLATKVSTPLSENGGPFLSGTCPVKPLYGLGHGAAAQFQGVGNPLIVSAIFMWSNTSFFQILREFFAMLNFQWPVWESERTTFNTPAPHSHLRPCNTNESHDTREGKSLIGPSLDIVNLGVYSLLLLAVKTLMAVCCYFEGTVNVHCYTSCTHYFTL